MPAAEQQHTVDQLAKDLQNESDPMLRRQILRTLGACPPASATPIIATALSDQDVETRRTACLALGDRGGKDAVQELTRVITTDASVDVRLAAVRAMGTTGDASAVAPLAEVMGDADPAVKARAYESITAVSGRDYGTDVQAWRQYAQTGTTTVPEVSFTAKLRKMFY
jgi:HEAT repeat protein